MYKLQLKYLAALSESNINCVRKLCLSQPILSSRLGKYVLTIKKKNMNYGKPMKMLINITNKALYGPLVRPADKLKRGKNLTSRCEAEQINKEFDNTENGRKEFSDKPIKINKNEDDKGKLIKIDNNKYEDVPSELNTNKLETFPLFSTKLSEQFIDKYIREIKRINIFDSGFRKLPSVITVLNETMPAERREILAKWEQKMIKQLGEEGFRNHQQGLFDRGKIIHECIDIFLTAGKDPTETQLTGIKDTWLSVKHILPEISDIRVMESRVIHPYLYYQGAVDCVATFRDMPVVIEFKTSTKPKLTLKSTYDNPLQLVAYLGALHYDPEYIFSQVKGALLVVAYPTGLPAHAHLLTQDECLKYWRLWCKRLSAFWKMNSLPDMISNQT